MRSTWFIVGPGVFRPGAFRRWAALLVTVVGVAGVVGVVGVVSMACGGGSKSRLSLQRPPRDRAALTAAALDSTRSPADRVAALVALQGRGELRASAAATVSLCTHADPAVATAAMALRRVSEGRAEIVGRRVAVIGASLSAGVGAKPLAVLLKRGLPSQTVVVDCADALTFERPASKTLEQIRRAQAKRADVILALDTLFWFAYHNRSPEAKRAYLERGLKVLERVGVVLLLGDLPDMRGASEILIPPSNVPSAQVLGAMNRRIRQWASKRLHVHVLPFSAWARPLLSKGRIRPVPHGPSIRASDALLTDGLHPNGKGTLYLLHRIFGEIHRAFPRTSAERFRTTPKLVDQLMNL